jgi:hypothetical protein
MTLGAWLRLSGDTSHGRLREIVLEAAQDQAAERVNYVGSHDIIGARGSWAEHRGGGRAAARIGALGDACQFKPIPDGRSQYTGQVAAGNEWPSSALCLSDRSCSGAQWLQDPPGPNSRSPMFGANLARETKQAEDRGGQRWVADPC